jgi:hypothetical protein
MGVWEALSVKIGRTDSVPHAHTPTSFPLVAGRRLDCSNYFLEPSVLEVREMSRAAHWS